MWEGKVMREQKYLSLAFLVVLLLFLGACSRIPQQLIGLGAIERGAVNVPGVTTHRIFVATTRKESDDSLEFFSGERSGALSLAQLDVSVPPAHKIGGLERPRSDVPDPQKHFIVSNAALVANAEAFDRKIDAELATRKAGERDVLVFIHGYNVNFSDAVLRVAQFVHDSGFKGVPVLFSWASRGRVADYVYDLNSALQARDRFEKLGAILAKTRAENFDIVAHSMGNLVVVEALRQAQIKGVFNESGRLRRVILASPDIDVDLFKTQLEVFPEKEKQFYVLISKDDRALELSRRLAGGVSRVGATDPVKLARLGINVVDVTEINDESSANHSKFTNSPAIVQLIGKSLQEGSTLEAREATSRAEALVGNVFKSLTLIPSAIIDGAQGSLLVVGNQ